MLKPCLSLAACGLLLATPFFVAPAQEPAGPVPPPGPGGGGPIGSGRGGTMLAEIDELVRNMFAFDKNKDGRIARAEVTDDRLLGLFDRADIDKDGAVTKEELTMLGEKEYVPGRSFGGGPGGPGGPPMPRPGEVLPMMLQFRLKLSGEQRAKVAELQAEVDARLAKILNGDQKAELKQIRDRPPGGPGGMGGPGGPGGPRRGGPGGGGPPDGGRPQD